MRMTLVEVVKNGERGYLISPSRLCMKPVTDNPLEAKNYEQRPFDLPGDLRALAVEGDELVGRSALVVDAPPFVVELEASPGLAIAELSRRPGREASGELGAAQSIAGKLEAKRGQGAAPEPNMPAAPASLPPPNR